MSLLVKLASLIFVGLIVCAVFSFDGGANEYGSDTKKNDSLFFGVNSGYSLIELDALNEQESKNTVNNTIVGLYTGYQWNENLEISVGNQLSSRININNRDSVLDSSIYYAAIGYEYNLMPDLSVLSRLGVAHWSFKQTRGNSVSFSKTYRGISPLVELGVEYEYTQRLSMYAGYRYIPSIGDKALAEFDSSTFLLGVRYYFGSIDDKPNLSLIAKSSIKTNIRPTSSSTVVNTASVQSSIQLASTDKPQVELKTSKNKILAEEKVKSETTTHTVLFGFGTGIIAKEQKHSLKEWLSTLSDKKIKQVEIIGHASVIGSEKFNLWLSEKRSKSVGVYFAKDKVKYSMVTLKAEGEQNPVCEVNSEECHKQDQRVEIHITAMKIK